MVACWFFLDVALGSYRIAGNDPVITDEGATVRDRIAGKSRHERTHFQVPHLQRLVLTGGRRPPAPTYDSPFTDQPLRYWRRRKWLASERLNFIFFAFHFSEVWGKREAIPPSRMASVSGPE